MENLYEPFIKGKEFLFHYTMHKNLPWIADQFNCGNRHSIKAISYFIGNNTSLFLIKNKRYSIKLRNSKWKFWWQMTITHILKMFSCRMCVKQHLPAARVTIGNRIYLPIRIVERKLINNNVSIFFQLKMKKSFANVSPIMTK